MKRTVFVVFGLLLLFTVTIISAKKEVKQKETSYSITKK